MDNRPTDFKSVEYTISSIGPEYNHFSYKISDRLDPKKLSIFENQIDTTDSVYIGTDH